MTSYSPTPRSTPWGTPVLANPLSLAGGVRSEAPAACGPSAYMSASCPCDFLVLRELPSCGLWEASDSSWAFRDSSLWRGLFSLKSFQGTRAEWPVYTHHCWASWNVARPHRRGMWVLDPRPFQKPGTIESRILMCVLVWISYMLKW